jgi:hypothetical protein
MILLPGAGTVPPYHRSLCSGAVSQLLPAVSIPIGTSCRDGEEEEILSSGQVSPICKLPLSFNSQHYLIVPFLAHFPRNHLGIGPSVADTSTSNLSSYERRVSEFNKIWPERPPAPFRVTTWPDSRSARGDISPKPGYRRRGGSKHHVRDETFEESTRWSSGEGIKGKKGTYANAIITR